ncbi:MAG: glycosyltransferase family 4 protein [Siculibacillus sp.]|nr:glycosyltransferase family 4 protein [Siculibacillus sp.]
MPRPIAFNLVRTVLGAANGVPRGIDRIDFGYLRNLFESWPADCVGVLPTPWGTRFFSRERVLRGCEVVAAIWKENDRGGDDPALERLHAAWTSPLASQLPRRAAKTVLDEIPDYLRALRLFLSGGPRIGRSVDRLSPGALYLDIGHRGLSRPAALDWLDRRPDVAPVFMIHDVIPMEFPDLVSPARRATHRTVMDTTAQRAKAVLTPTAAAAAGIREELARRGKPDLPVHPVTLPVDDLFLGPVEPDPVIAARPYFLVCGAVEPRKNHAVLIEAWTRLAAEAGAAVPRLLIVGAADNAIAGKLRAEVERRGLADHVVFASGLTSPSIARLMAGARALLMPSLAEGFGLPPVEAMAVGTPAVVSDIPAHRDSAGDAAIYAATGDVDAWVEAIGRLAADGPAREEVVRRVRDRVHVDWRAHMDAVREVLVRVG